MSLATRPVASVPNDLAAFWVPFTPNRAFKKAPRLIVRAKDMKDPLISPVDGDYAGFAPTILTSGTRDLLLSNTVRVHRKLRQAGVDAVLQVYEGLAHAQYYRDATAPESREAFEEIARFFDIHLGK